MEKTIIQYSFDANGGTVSTDSKEVMYNKQLGTLPTPTKEDSYFLGWSTSVSGENIVSYEDRMPAHDITLYAQWMEYSHGADAGIRLSIDQVELTLEELRTQNYNIPISVTVGLSPEITDTMGVNYIEYGISMDNRLDFDIRSAKGLYAKNDTLNFVWTTGGGMDLEPNSFIKTFIFDVYIPKDAAPGDLYKIEYAYKGAGGGRDSRWSGYVLSEEGYKNIDYLASGLFDWTDGYIKIADELVLKDSEITMKFGERYLIEANQANLTYKTGDSDVAVVSKDGVITAVGEGTTVILVINSESEVKQINVTVVPSKIVGDVNDDGIFSVADVVTLQKWLLNDGTKLSNWQAADLYEDGVINVFDLVMMKRKLLYG